MSINMHKNWLYLVRLLGCLTCLSDAAVTERSFRPSVRLDAQVPIMQHRAGLVSGMAEAHLSSSKSLGRGVDVVCLGARQGLPLIVKAFSGLSPNLKLGKYQPQSV